jgi:L-ornithine N5-oxygenase
VAYLHQEFASAEVCSVYARYGYAPADDSPFANRIFDPEAVDLYYGADDEVKRMLFDYHRNTNYSVVDGELIDELYRREYQERVKGTRRLRMMNASQVTEVDDSGDTLKVSVRAMPTGEVEILDTDVLVYATGYRPGDAVRLLGDAGGLVERLPDGAPAVHRDYRLELRVPSQAGVYVQGGTEHSHGISSSLLSNVAVRTGEIVESVAARRGDVVGVGSSPQTSAGEPVRTGFVEG